VVRLERLDGVRQHADQIAVVVLLFFVLWSFIVYHNSTLEPRWFCGGQRTSTRGYYTRLFIAVAYRRSGEEVWRGDLTGDVSEKTR